MYGGFDPRASQTLFFERRRGRGLLVASLVYGAMFAGGLRHRTKQETVEVQLEPEIKDLAVDQEPEPEVEDEPPPPVEAPAPRVRKPRPRPELRPPDEEVKEAAPETDKSKAYEVGSGPGRAGGTGAGKSKPADPQREEELPPKKAEKPKIDPKAVVDRPEKATAPVADPGNQQPEYPKELRERGITGVVVIKLYVKDDGTLEGAKILKVTNNAATEEEREQANALFKKAVIAVVRNWKYTPAKLEGQPITVWHTVTIPFRLSMG